MKWLALLAGLLFGTGLILSGMADPAKVLGFLDFTRVWDPSLAFVMGAAVVTAAPAFWWARRHGKTWSGAPLVVPAGWPLDRALIVGAVIFGLGWGLSGLCPGPALVGAAGGSLPIFVFVLAMAAGMALSAFVRRHIHRT